MAEISEEGAAAFVKSIQTIQNENRRLVTDNKTLSLELSQQRGANEVLVAHNVEIFAKYEYYKQRHDVLLDKLQSLGGVVLDCMKEAEVDKYAKKVTSASTVTEQHLSAIEAELANVPSIVKKGPVVQNNWSTEL